MIKINLLPVRASKKREAGKQWVALFVFVVSATLLGNYIWMNETDKQVDAVNARVKRLNDDLATLNKIIGEVKNIKEEKEAIQKKLDILKKLKDGRTGPVKVMDELATLIPQGVWVNNWTEESGGNMTFTGSGKTYDEVAVFAKKLRDSKYFTNVVLKSTRQVGENRCDFTVTVTVNYAA